MDRTRIPDFGWFLLRRLAFALVVLVALFTAMFLVVVLTQDPGLIERRFLAGTQEAAEMAEQSYAEERGRDRPLAVQYVDWLVGYATLEWGWSHSQNAPVLDLVREASAITGLYVVPAVLASTAASVGLGYASAVGDRRAGESALRLVVYACAAVPAFLVAAVAFNLLLNEFKWYTGLYDSELGLFARRNLETLVIPSIVLAVSLFGAQTRYVRSQSRKYVGMEFTKLARAKGAGPIRVARHVLTNAAMPLVSVTFTELLSVFVLTVFVIEIIFDIPGIGLLGYEAIQDRDLGLMFGTMLVPALIAIVGNVVQDLVYARVDPRVDLE